MKKETENFYNEIYYRCNSAVQCLDTFEYVKQKPLDNLCITQTIKYSLIRLSILQIATILDKTSEFSLRIRATKDGSYLVDLSRIKTLCSNIDSNEAQVLKNELDKLLNRNKLLVRKILEMRNKRIAHSGSSSYEKNKLDMKIFGFPTVRMVKFADNLQGIFNKRIFIKNLKLSEQETRSE